MTQKIKVLVRLLCVLWLIGGLPLVGLMPFVYVLFRRHLSPEIIWMWWAFLRIFWTPFWEDPEPDTEHIPPPFSDRGYLLMGALGVLVSFVAIYYLRRSGRVRESEPVAT